MTDLTDQIDKIILDMTNALKALEIANKCVEDAVQKTRDQNVKISRKLMRIVDSKGEEG